jgi:hypothetical protein
MICSAITGMKKTMKRSLAILLFALGFLTGCDDSSTPSASNFTKAINQQLSALPLCWGLTNNNIDTSKSLQVNLGFDEAPRILAAAKSAGILSFDVEPSQMGWKIVFVVFKKPEAWDKKSGLCYGRKVVDKIGNWTQPANNMTEVNFHWRIEPAGWTTTAALNAIGIQTEGDSGAVLQLMNTGWQ